ncbi:MAG: alpha/beta hydrolase fold domain-containing protein [Pseudomonadota bacterium]
MNSAIDQNLLPGRLGNTDADILSDRRLDPRIKAALELAPPFEAPEGGVSERDSYADLLDFCLAFEQAGEATHPLQHSVMPEFAVNVQTQVISGIDDNPINLYIHSPTNQKGLLPGVVHTHGGGMVLMTAQDPGFVRWRSYLASLGLVVIGVEFRNGGGKLGNHPFPAGLNDCASATQWIAQHKSELGISHLVISGESGGGNLSIATTMKALQEGWVNKISGVFAMCPYISGVYADPPGNLLSLTENDGYLLSCEMMGGLAKIYDPEGQHKRNPLAWPYHANAQELQGLPPHFISVNELDPLRDEGLAFYRKLVNAGVSAVAQTVHGTPHAGDVTFPDLTPEVYASSADALYNFAGRVA